MARALSALIHRCVLCGGEAIMATATKARLASLRQTPLTQRSKDDNRIIAELGGAAFLGMPPHDCGTRGHVHGAPYTMEWRG